MNSEWAEPPEDQGSKSLATPGAQLAAQREAMGWTIEQIADQLKLAPRQVKALEAGDYAALPNMAVVRGFVRAYAKVVKLDATPLVAMIEVASPTSHEVAPPRKELSASFSESRFPSMTGRSSSSPAGWLVGLVIAAAVAGGGFYAYETGLIKPGMFERSDKDVPASASAEQPKPADALAPIETTTAKPGEETAPLQTPNVPLISVPPPADAAAASAPPAQAPAPAAVAPPAPAPAQTPAPAVAAPAAQAAPPATVAFNAKQLVLKVTEDSWVEIRVPGTKPLISRLVKAGSTEAFDIKDAALLIVGKPAGVEATLGGAPLALPPISGGTISRVNIK